MYSTRKEEVDWINDPQSLVGERIEVKWKGGKRYKGLVTKYQSTTKIFTVLYDDGDEKHYDLFDKTFRVEGESSDWAPELSRPLRNTRSSGATAPYSAQNPLYNASGRSNTSNNMSNIYGNTGYSAHGHYHHHVQAYKPRYRTPFVSKFPNASTAVTFHCLLDPRAQKEGEVVFLNGSLDILTSWNGGIPMQRAEDNECLWSVTVQLPISEGDRVNNSYAGVYGVQGTGDGMFQYRYEIRLADDDTENRGEAYATTPSGATVLIEGQAERIEHNLKLHFFHSFRPNYKFRRFKGWSQSNKSVFQQYVQHIIFCFQNGCFGADEFLTLFGRIKAEITESKRTHVEELFEDALELSSNLFDSKDTEGNGMTLLGLFLAMVGSYGVTSHEVSYAAGSGGFTSYSYVGGVQVPGHNYGYAAQPTKKLPPKPSVWCIETVKHIDVVAFYELQWDTVYGSFVQGRWIAVAIQEAIERLSEHGSYEWLRVYPLVKKVNIKPRIVHPTPSKKDKKASDLHDSFISVAVEVCDLINVQESTLESLNSMPDETDIEADDYVSNEQKGQDEKFPVLLLNEPELKDNRVQLDTAVNDISEDIGLSNMFNQAEKLGNVKSRKLIAKRLMKDWLHGIIVFAPALSTLARFLRLTMHDNHQNKSDQTASGIPPRCREDVVAALTSKIATADLDKKEQINELSLLLDCVESLRCPEIATSLFKNTDLDKKTDTLCKFVSNCLKDQVWWNENPKHPDYNNKAAALSGKWHELSVAAKEYIMRKHSAEPEPVMETVRVSAAAEPSSGYFGTLWNTVGTTQYERRPKILSNKEQQDQYRQLMADALEDVNLLITEIPLFAVHSNGLLFELGRCWFLKGAQHRVLDALCFNAQQIAKETQMMDSSRFASPIVHFLHERSLKLIEDMCLKDDGHAASDNRHFVNNSALKVLRIVTDVLTAEEELAHALLFELIRIVTKNQLQESNIPSQATANFAATLLSSLTIDPPPVPAKQSSTSPDVSALKPNLTCTLENCSLWERLLIWIHANNERRNISDSSLRRSVNNVRSLLARTIDLLQSLTLTLEHMHTLMKFENQFYSLLDSFDIDTKKGINQVFLASSQKVRCFDETLEQVQTYASFFCSCGVKVQAVELRSVVEGLRRRYKTLRIDELENAINNQNTLALPYTSWLYNLRGSELFLFFWRLVGRNVCLERIGGAGRQHCRDDEQDDSYAQGMGLGALFDENPVIEGIELNLDGGDEDETIQNIANQEEEELRNVERLDGESDEDFAARVAVLQQARMNRLQRQFEVQDRRAQLMTTVDEVELTQEEVVEKLLPQVQTVWSKVAHDTFTGAILMSELNESFSVVLDKKGNEVYTSDRYVITRLSEELRLLSIGLDGVSRDQIITAQNLALGSDIATILNVTTKQMQDFIFLRKLLKWIPCLLHVHELLRDLFLIPVEEDPFRMQLINTRVIIDTSLKTLTLRDMSELVSELQNIFEGYNTSGQVDFIAALSYSTDMTNWLLSQSSTEEFNQLLQVVRPCTDEPRMLSAIASLVHVRTLLLQPLYAPLTGREGKYNSFLSFLGAFKHMDLRSTGGADGISNADALWHINNIVDCFEGLMDVFEKQTRSPGIKSCYDLKDILDRGTFVLSASATSSKIISLQLAAKGNVDVGGENTSTESIDYLLDLRSKLLMTEIPQELEDEMQVREMVDAFVVQLQVLSELADTLASLCIAGHVSYQEDQYSEKFPFRLDGLSPLQGLLSTLLQEQEAWAMEVKNMRKKYYYLNFFTMREILRIRSLVMNYRTSKDSDTTEGKVTEEGYLPEVDNEIVKSELKATLNDNDANFQNCMANIEEMEQMGFSRDWAVTALRRTGDNIERAIEFCFANTQVMDRFVAEDAAALVQGQEINSFGSGTDVNSHDTDPQKMDAFQNNIKLDPISELHGLLHLVSSNVDILCVHQLIHLWQGTEDINDGSANSSTSEFPEENKKSSVLAILGHILSQIFNDDGPNTSRRISLPLEGAVNQVDMLVTLEESSSASCKDLEEKEKKIPLFVSCADSPLLVIDTVLSVYIRRGHLPEPGELMFCTADTTLEDLTLMLFRFINAKSVSHGENSSVFCIADLHNLSYTLQSALVEKIRNVTDEFGTNNAATLLLVSGLSKQVALNALSAHLVDLPPLDLEQLRVSLAEAFRLHCGDTLCVASEINGGGKSHFIMEEIGQRQRDGENIWYRKIPVREGTNHESLVQLLTKSNYQGENLLADGDRRTAFHVDIAHIIPPAANTMLFQLLLVGVLRDPVKNRVYSRSSTDMFFIEVPNSTKNKSIKALRFCNMLPHIILQVAASSLKFVRPVVQDYGTQSYPVAGTHVRLEEYIELRYVCQWLKGVRDGKTRCGSDNYDALFSPWSGSVGSNGEQDSSRGEYFDILVQYCCKPDSAAPLPSFSLFRNFIMFMNMQFGAVEKYSLLSSDVLAHIDGMQNFKHIFLTLLISTSCDFSVRSVPQVLLDAGGVGPSVEAQVLYEDTENSTPNQGVGVMNLEELPPPPLDRRGSNDSLSLGPPPMVRRTSSEERRAAVAQGQQNAIPGMVRQTSEEIVNRFQHMLSWEQSEHPIVCFKMDMYGEVNGVDILSLNAAFVDRYISGELKHALEENYIKFNKDWSTMTNEEGVTILRQIAGLSVEQRGGLASLESGYVMTVDNLLKMLSIQLRLRFNLPVVIMGETGCGKSTLIRNMCAILGAPLHILNVHGGIEDADIISWMTERIALANRMTANPSERLVLLLDEINTCNSMGLFKEIVCDRTLNGVPFPDKIQIIAACNPYRLRTSGNLYGGEEMAGLVYEQGGLGGSGIVENVGTGIKDPLRNLVYRVHPLPESMIDHIYDFGALSSETESLYIKAMLRKHLEMYSGERLSAEEVSTKPAAGANVFHSLYQYRAATTSPLKEFVEVYAELICAAQECIRDLHDGERSAASLRDVSRCMKVFIWFGQHLANTVGVNEGWTMEDFFSMRAVRGQAHRNAQLTPKVQRAVRRSVILSLAYCYHARLPREERKILVKTLTQKWRSLQTYQHYPGGGYGGGGGINYFNHMYNRPKCTWLNLDVHTFTQVLDETQREFVSVMNLGDGIALNEALCENLFMILCSILNQIPIFVIGKPGSSKSLAMGLVQSNLNGDASEHPFLKTLPAVEVFSYQCSPLSTSQGIEQAFESSRRYRREAENTVVVVLLDEVGLAEQSPHLPLKVLHKVLDEAGGREAVVGISNWALDPAKMNRAVHLYRPAPTVEDLSLTAEGMVRSANLKGYLHELARAYNEIYHNQEHADFWGLREFYSTVKSINSSLERESIATGGAALDGHMLMNSILRNFGGRPHEMNKIISCFFHRLGISVPSSSIIKSGESAMEMGSLPASALNTAGLGWKDVRIESLVRANLLEPIAARHLMLLTRNNAALSLLFDRQVLLQNETEVIFGSDFPLDQTDLTVCLNIQKVKLCMAEGITVVLVHCESLYESLYDLLNQHYVEYSGQIYVRLAFGSYTRLCPLHRNFRVIVVVEKEEAYTKLAPPLLNRFEKQVFERSDVLVDSQKKLLNKLRRFAVAFAQYGSKGNGNDSGNEFSKSFGAIHRENDASCSLATLRAAFCGYHSDILSSLILTVQSDFDQRFTEHKFENIVENNSLDDGALDDIIFKECVKRLLWIATPEVTCALMLQERAIADLCSSFQIDDPATEYFQRQCHSSLPAFFKRIVPHWQDSLGAQLILLTYSALTQDVACIVESQGGFHVTHVVLHELDQERELRSVVTSFFQTAEQGSLLLVQCDPIATSRRRIEHTKFLIELYRAKKYQSKGDCDQKRGGNYESLQSNEFKGEGGGELMEVESNNDMVPGEKLQPHSSNERKHGDDEENLLKELNSLQNSQGIHVVILVHLPRGDTTNVWNPSCPKNSADSYFSLDFDTRWRVAFVDCMSSSNNGLPEAEAIIHRPLLDLVSSKILNLKQLLLAVCRSSLAKLYTTFDRSNADVRRQINEITRCLQQPCFVELCQGTLEILLRCQESDKMATNDITSKALNERELQLAGSFQGALHKQIHDSVSALFALVLGHMDRNCSLSLYQLPGPNTTSLIKNQIDIWKYLFTQSFNPSLLLSQMKNANSHLIDGSVAKSFSVSIELKSDAYDGIHTFSSRFPFSFYLLPLFETLRKVGGTDSPSLNEAQLHGQIRTLCLEHMDHLIDGNDVNEECLEVDHLPWSTSTSISNFIHDLVCMRCKAVTGISRDKQATIVQQLMSMVCDEESDRAKITRFSQLLRRFWILEPVLVIYFDLLDTLACNDNAEKVLRAKMNSHIEDCVSYFQKSSSSDPSLISLEKYESDSIPRNVHKGLLEAVLHYLNPCPDTMSLTFPNPDKSSSSYEFKAWASLLSSLHAPFFALLDFITDRRDKELLMMRFLHYEFYLSFLRDVAWPYSLTARQVWAFMKRFERSPQPVALSSCDGLQNVLEGLLNIGSELWAVDGIPHDFLCPITLERMSDPVVAADGHTYERRAIEEWISSGRTTSPFDTSNDRALISQILVPNVALKTRLEQWDEGVDLSTFLEYYLLDVVFHALHRRNIACDLVKDVVQLLAGNFLHEGDGEPNVRRNIAKSLLPSGNAIEGVIRELFSIQDCAKEGGEDSAHYQMLSEAIDISLEKELNASSRDQKYVDTPICVAYSNVRQDILSSENGIIDASLESFPVDEHLLRNGAGQISPENSVSNASVRSFLDAVACMRCFMTSVAGKLCHVVDNEGCVNTNEKKNLEAMLARMNHLLDDTNMSGKDSTMLPMIHSMRMYFLKVIAQSRGVSFVRQVLLTPPLNEALWLKQWRDGLGVAANFSGIDTIAFTRFLGSNLLPQINPFLTIPGYKRIQADVAQVLQSGDITILVKALFSPVQSESHSRYICGLLLLALFNEVALLSLLPMEAVQSQLQSRAKMIENWIHADGSQQPSSLAVLSPGERHCLIFFGLGRFSVAASNVPSEKQRLLLSPSSPPTCLLQVRIITQVVAVGLMSPPSHPGHFFHSLIFKPGVLIANASTLSEGSYMPTMPEDIVKMAQNVMGGRWYACPNGHPFYVDYCGRPTVIRTCAECGAKIGGEDHNLLSDNKDLGNVGSGYYDKTVLEDRSERLYCVRPAADEKAQGLTMASPRELSPTSTRVIRILMHLAMVAGVNIASFGSLASLKEKMGQTKADGNLNIEENVWSAITMQRFFNSSFAAPKKYAHFLSFLNNHVDQDWGVLQSLSGLQEDEVGLILHGILNNVIEGLGTMQGFCENNISSDVKATSAATYSFENSLNCLNSKIKLPNRTQCSKGKERSFAACALSSDRAFWESYMDKVHILPWTTPPIANESGITTLSDHLESLSNPWSLENKDDGNEKESGNETKNKGSASLFAVMLLEKDSSPLLKPTLQISTLFAERQALLPTLWRLPRVFRFDEFVSSLNLLESANSDNKTYPVLFSFLSTFAADAGQLTALRFLPEVLEWFNGLRRLYCGHITREVARKMTQSDYLRDVARRDPGGHWDNVFRGYTQAWNSSWSNVQKYGCIQFSPDFKSIEMGPDVPLTFALPNSMDEGNCPLALVHFLVEKQNTFAQLIDEYFLMQQKNSVKLHDKNGAASRRVGVVSSRFLTAAHTIRCDIHRELVPLFEKHCLLAPHSSSNGHTSIAGGMKYDFGKAERLLVERFLMDLPAVDLEMPGFTFKNEQHLQGGMGPLRQKLKQSPLSYEQIQALQRDIKTPQHAQQILDLVETIIAFVTATGGSLITKLNEDKLGSMKIGHYVNDVLMLPLESGNLGGVSYSRVVLHQVQLTHLEALHNFLSEITNCDIFAKVHEAYKKPLHNMHRRALEDDVLQNPAFIQPSSHLTSFLLALRTFICESLQDKVISTEVALFEVMQWREIDDVYLGDLEWFMGSPVSGARGFPQNVRVEEAVAVYEMLHAAQRIE